jgi:hypothetical protein
VRRRPRRYTDGASAVRKMTATDNAQAECVGSVLRGLADVFDANQGGPPVGSPELPVNRVSHDELARPRREDPQQLESLWSELHRALRFAEL